jgi:hypothetical protein
MLPARSRLDMGVQGVRGGEGFGGRADRRGSIALSVCRVLFLGLLSL